MGTTVGKKSDFKNFRAVRPQAISLSRQELVEAEYLRPDSTLPLVLRPKLEEFDLVGWAASNREFIAAKLLEHGGVLFRGFDVGDASRFEEFARVFSPELMDYLDQHTPRTKLSGYVYTSTEYPADQHIPFHSENSKNHVWPLKLWFCCLQPAERGGETPIADNRRVFALLDPALKERFVEKRVMYVRNFGEGVGLSWQTAFQTSSRAVVEEYCRGAGMECVWKDEQRLRLRHVCQAVARHPETGEAVWFNQAHLFHVAGLDAAVRDSMRALFREEDLPSNAFYGDGTAIEDSVIEDIRAAYAEAAVAFAWQAGDVLMLENMLVAHGRAPYAGPRRVLVAMAEPHGD
jgi:alpha-ketoglutarate-dependent taurine dioxygenase